MKGTLSFPSIERYINLSYRVLAAFKLTVPEAHFLFDSLYSIVFKRLIGNETNIVNEELIV